jgi:S1-C subfamily serine protease
LTIPLATENRLTGVKGVLVDKVDPNGIVADVKVPGRQDALAKGDLITRINRKPVSTVSEFSSMVSQFKPGDAVVLHVSRYDFRTRTIRQRIVQFTFQ